MARRGILQTGKTSRPSCVSVSSFILCFLTGYFLRGLHEPSWSGHTLAKLSSGGRESAFSFGERPDEAVGKSAFQGNKNDLLSSTEQRSHPIADLEPTAQKALFEPPSSVGDMELRAILERTAINNEVVAAVSNHALITPDGKAGMLRIWVDGLRHAGVKNLMVICLDDQVYAAMQSLDVPCWRKDPKKTADKDASNHGISALKFQLIKEFLVLGYSVLLSDVDILTLKNPFNFLHRDHDIEALSDGFDELTAYGYDDVMDDPKMGWSRYAHTVRVFMLNSGLFYTKANEQNIKLMDRITDRLMKEKAWDQAVFNEEIFFPSHGSYLGSHITVRVMDIYDFVNSKTLFRTMRYEPRFTDHVPVMVHVNYHPDKYERIQDVWKRYVDGDKGALDKYPVGSCKEDECPE